jgi:ABC-2 type transport system ATP-binding protein
MDGWTYFKFIVDAYLPAQRRVETLSVVNALCARLDLPVETLRKPVRTLSKGMTQKLALMGCLLSGRELLILDEPMSGLDPKARVLFRNIIGELRREGRTVLMCTHILSDIETLCDRVTILHAGRILFSGTARECCERYRVDGFESAFLKCIEGS